MRRRRIGRPARTAALVALTLPVATALWAQSGETGNGDAASLVADQIRDQGFACKAPTKATKDQDSSQPDEVVWILECADAAYRVRLIPDMAAHVEAID